MPHTARTPPGTVGTNTPRAPRLAKLGALLLQVEGTSLCLQALQVSVCCFLPGKVWAAPHLESSLLPGGARVQLAFGWPALGLSLSRWE